MKAINIGVLFFICSFSNIVAQELGTSEINLGYGLNSSNQVINSITNSLFSGDDDVNTTSTGAIYVSYKVAISKKFMMGAVYAKEEVDSEKIRRPENTVSERISAKVNTLAIESDYRYVSKETLQLYSGIGIGYTFGEEDFLEDSSFGRIEEREKINYLNCQFNFFGVRYGKSIAVFAEIGYGYKGVLNAGISAQF